MTEFIIDILYKFLITLVVLIMSLIFKPVRRRFADTRISRFIMRKLGMEKHKVVVCGKVFPKPYGSGKELLSFEVELPFKDISDNIMPIRESDYLIMQALNKKYGRNFDTENYYFNNIRPKKVTYYQKKKKA